MHYSFYLSLTVLLCAVVSQMYSIVLCQFLTNGNTFVRLVLGNELVILWTSISGSLSTWCAAHIMAIAFRPSPNQTTAKAKIRWLPIGNKALAWIWLGFVPMSIALAATHLAMLYPQQLGYYFCLAALNATMPILAASIALPTAVHRLKTTTNSRQMLSMDDINDHTISPATVALTLNTVYPDSPGNRSLTSKNSGNSNASRVTDGTQIADTPMLKYSPSVFPSLLESSRAAENGRYRVAGALKWLLSLLGNICEYRLLALVIALLSLTLYSLSINATYQQSQYIANTPRAVGRIVSVIGTYADDSRHPIHLSIRCTGAARPHIEINAKPVPQQATIIIEHMAGNPSPIAASLQNALIKQNRRICSYDRPGYMFSPQGFAPLSPKSMARALFQALEATKETGPFYLVGQYSGSEYAEIFSQENRQHVVGMALVYPTDVALRGLLSNELTLANQTTIIESVQRNSRLQINTSATALHLTTQRVFSALGFGLASNPVITGLSEINDRVVDWGISNPNLPQAQYFEKIQESSRTESITNLKTTTDDQPPLSVVLFGVNVNTTTEEMFISALDSQYKVEISDPNENRAPSFDYIARQIAWHITCLH